MLVTDVQKELPRRRLTAPGESAHLARGVAVVSGLGTQAFALRLPPATIRLIVCMAAAGAAAAAGLVAVAGGGWRRRWLAAHRLVLAGYRASQERLLVADRRDTKLLTANSRLLQLPRVEANHIVQLVLFSFFWRMCCLYCLIFKHVYKRREPRDHFQGVGASRGAWISGRGMGLGTDSESPRGAMEGGRAGLGGAHDECES